MARERINASRNVLIGLRVVMCLTSDWFHANRSTNVLIRMERTKMRSSVKTSFIFLAFARSLSILFITNIFFYDISNEETIPSSEWF